MTIALVILAVVVVVGFLAMLGISPHKHTVPRPVPHPQAERELSGSDFSCRVSVNTEQSKTGISKIFRVEIKGVINAPSDKHDTRLRVTVDERADSG